MITFDDATKENRKQHDPDWLQMPEYPCRILITGGFWSRT